MTDGNDFSQSANGIIVSLIKPMKEDLVFRHFQWPRKMHLSATTDFPLPSTGRGIKGEGWERSGLPALNQWALPMNQRIGARMPTSARTLALGLNSRMWASA